MDDGDRQGTAEGSRPLAPGTWQVQVAARFLSGWGLWSKTVETTIG